jgi:MYXO-CTERM domain-containing protein
VLRPYVAAGMKFFVAKVDVKKVQFNPKGQAMLSPLRFHYDSETFNLPVRLGLLNSSGAQDLIVHILARSRFELANYPNVTIPTNIEVKDGVRGSFGQFYVSLFDATLAHNPKAIVTEYAWQANNCDPCPVQPLQVEELSTLGADVLPSVGQIDDSRRWSLPGEFVLTRLHARYSKESLGEDLVFREAPAIVGGREVEGAGGKIEQGPSSSSINNFQARYIIRHLWKGAVLCLRPRFGRWGGPPKGESGSQQPAVARDLAFADRTGNLVSYVAQDVPEIRLTVAAGEAPPVVTPPVGAPPTVPAPPKAAVNAGGCGCAVDETGAGWLLLGLAGLGLRRRQRIGG